MQDQSMLERIHAHLTDEGACPPSEIATRFLRLQTTGPAADRLVASILGREDRFARQEDGSWVALHRPPGDVQDVPFTCVSVLPQGGDPAVEVAAVRVRGGIADASFRSPPDTAPGPDAVREVLELARDGVIVGEHSPTTWRWLTQGGVEEVETPGLSLGRLGKVLFPDLRIRSLGDLATQLGLRMLEGEDAHTRARATGEVLAGVLAHCQSIGVTDRDSLLAHQYDGDTAVDFSRFAFDRDDLRALPQTPGVYVMTDADGECLYVGKARSLKNRVHSYLFPASARDPRVASIVERLHDLETHEVGSELEALLLENRLIGELEPPLNTQIQIQPRRTPIPRRILVLPTTDTETVRLYAFTDHDVLEHETSRHDPVDDDLAQLLAAALTPPAEARTTATDNATIAARWFDSHRDHLTWLDLATVVDPREGATRLRTLIHAFDPASGPQRAV